MKYTTNGRTFNIPDDEIDNYVEKLELTIDEAINLWLEDKGFQDNAEQDELDKKANSNKAYNTVGTAAKKTAKPRKRVNSDEKQAVFNAIHEFLDDFCTKNDASYEITKENKRFCIVLNGKQIEIDLIEHRTPKKAEN